LPGAWHDAAAQLTRALRLAGDERCCAARLAAALASGTAPDPMGQESVLMLFASIEAVPRQYTMTSLSSN
jgi:hypothetical protein